MFLRILPKRKNPNAAFPASILLLFVFSGYGKRAAPVPVLVSVPVLFRIRFVGFGSGVGAFGSVPVHMVPTMRRNWPHGQFSLLGPEEGGWGN